MSARDRTTVENPGPGSLVVDDLAVDLPTRAGVTRALAGVSLQVAPGRLLAVVGESGSGKSTLVRTLAGALPGGARVRGRAMLRAEGSRRELDLLAAGRPSRSLLPRTSPLAGRVIGVVPQSASTSLTAVRTVGSQLAQTCRALGSRHTPAALLDRVGLAPGDASLYPHELSGGMAQRAAIAFAIAGDPLVVLADEPTSALDADLTGQVLRLLRESADAGAIVVVVTHDLEQLEASGVADEVAVVRGGQVVEHGPTERVLIRPQHPYTRCLVGSLPSRRPAMEVAR